MNTKRLAAAGLATAAVATVVPFALAAPASADVEKVGNCAGARYDFDVDRERGGYEVSFEVDSNTPNQKWRLVLFHNGDRVFRDVRTTDREGEVDFERLRPNTPGADTFRAKAVKLSNGQSCSVRITR
ncbi:MAG TPA: hypothetical protein VFY86_09045 [Nocardioides sp.]|jgi:hypothetical protein|nr:hypothetical protein [uncultured Nocardioides sp.]HEX5986652.1 hypothetical protein [Nocardioides sp.]